MNSLSDAYNSINKYIEEEKQIDERICDFYQDKTELNFLLRKHPGFSMKALMLYYEDSIKNKKKLRRKGLAFSTILYFVIYFLLYGFVVKILHGETTSLAILNSSIGSTFGVVIAKEILAWSKKDEDFKQIKSILKKYPELMDSECFTDTMELLETLHNRDISRSEELHASMSEYRKILDEHLESTVNEYFKENDIPAVVETRLESKKLEKKINSI